ncbi:MAG: LysE family translocator [Rhodobacteraceae bacterium]|nr:MAG: LysE family translocator [Paracoccaceae bacterium]
MTVTPVELVFYAGAILILFLTPGPVWVALTARAMSGGFASAAPLAVGVALGDMFWPLAAIFGLTWVLSIYGDLLEALKWVAMGMFVIMGVQLIRHAATELSTDSRLNRPGALAGFAAGVTVILANPKAILFYMGVLPGFFDLSRVTWADIAAILAVSALIPIIGNLLMALAIDRARALLRSGTALARANRVAGVLLIGVGIVIGLN